MPVTLELLLVSGDRRRMALPSHTGSVANFLDRLDDWIETSEGALVQKCHVVEVRVIGEDRAPGPESTEELRQLDAAAGQLARAADRPPPAA